ncbi:hypothetical protein [Cryobacterium zhongshanensis]|uniref:ATP-grasp domain-containing protein n=1 Tax=Cryobacterium zhongshanensis TaxID=2928153 RepID=A0AA41QZA0_9MICO|nr:hypothetical protein [Cryobacterium zhongshanensis]MCI4659554.1 hypothetical protein [Cryobacterium zhongshanensis]
MTIPLSDVAASTSGDLPQLFSGDLRPYPGIPDDWSEAKRQLAVNILFDVSHSFPHMRTETDPDADVEDFWEDAARLSAAWYATNGSRLVAKAPGTAETPWTADEMSRRLGPVDRVEDGGRHAVDKLVGHPLVRKYGGRGMLLGSIGGDPATDIITWMVARHRKFGVERAIVKATALKGGIWSIKLDLDPTVVEERLLEALGWDYVRLEGLADAVFVQDQLELAYEYRLFVVDGEVISGAGCIEEFTPLDRNIDDGSFDTRVRKWRGPLASYGRDATPSPVEYRIGTVAELVKFGRKVASEHGGTVVIDVAFDGGTRGNAHRDSGHPVVIELNTLPNSGLYASNPWLVAEKLMTATDRGYLL